MLRLSVADVQYCRIPLLFYDETVLLESFRTANIFYFAIAARIELTGKRRHARIHFPCYFKRKADERRADFNREIEHHLRHARTACHRSEKFLAHEVNCLRPKDPSTQFSSNQNKWGKSQCNGAFDQPAYGRCGYGTRMPLLVVSPFAKRNHVDHTLTDQSSVLRFIEDNWLNSERVQSGGSFDTIAGSIENMFDFRGWDERGPRKLILDEKTGAVVYASHGDDDHDHHDHDHDHDGHH